MRRSRAPSLSNKLVFKSPLLKQGNERFSSTNENINQNATDEKYGSDEGNDTHRSFTVVYGKRSTKKHKTWEGDGTLEVGLKCATLKPWSSEEDTGTCFKEDFGVFMRPKEERLLLLIDENGKVIGQVANIKTTELEEGSRLCIGSKEIEIVESIAPNKSSQKRPLDDVQNVTRESKKSKASPLTSLPIILKTNKSALHSVYEELILPRPTDEHQWSYNSDSLPITPVSVPAFLCRILRPHQREGVIFLYKCISGIRNIEYTGAILADEMGLGKTLQCISLIWTLLKSGPYGGKPLLKRVLIVVPSSLTQNWNNEFIRWIGSHRIRTFVVDKKKRPQDYADEPETPIFIVSYEMFMRGYDFIKDIKFDLIVCDEGHRLKNCSIKTTAALKTLACKRRILLTGTPIQNDLQEFFALVDLVNNGILGSQLEFRRSYIDPIVASKEPKASDEVVHSGEVKSEHLNRLTSAFILRRTQSVIDKFLPIKNEFVVFCEPSSFQKNIYSAVTDYWLKQFEEKVTKNETSEHLSVIHMLKKICNHPKLLQNTFDESSFSDDGLSSRIHRTLAEINLSTCAHNDSGKFKVVNVMLSKMRNTKERIVLVSNFTQTLDLFEEMCKQMGYRYLRFDGSTSTNARSTIVNNFNAPSSDVYILLLSSKAGGVGLNLIGGSRLILYDSDWNPATDLQAMARIWREGQKRPVYIYRLLTSGTIEEKIFQRQLSKAGLSESIVDPSATSNIKLSLEEMKDLFTYSGVEKCITHSSLKCTCDGDGSIPLVVSSQSSEDREAELLPENSSSLPSLRMNQLFQWEHHAKPIAPDVLKDMGLADAAEEINYVFKNKTQ